MKRALYYAEKCCDTMMRKFAAQQLPPVGEFHYHQGVFLSGMQKIYEICGEQKYYDYIKLWVDSIVYADGSINMFDRSMLDDIQPGILLFDLYRKSRDERYKKALDTLISVIDVWKCNPIGGFWHKECHPNQMWLDGLYMAGPILAEYSAEFGNDKYIEIAIKQAIMMYDHMQDKKTKLLYHAWDYSKEIWWANKNTGCSQEFWGRALGWYVVAVLDILKFVPRNHASYQKLIDIEREILEGIVGFQDEQSGMWYQIIDKGQKNDNWYETSCTALFTYALLRAIDLKIIDRSMLKYAKKGFDGIINNFVEFDGDNLLLSGVCIGTGVLFYEEYVARPTCVNDLHGIGAFLLMCSEMAKYEQCDL